MQNETKTVCYRGTPSAERTSLNSPSKSVYRSELPSERSKIRPKEFNQILRPLEERLTNTFRAPDIVQIEKDSNSLKISVHNSIVI